eukprot:1940831-Rhodomonas_salina.1
MQFFIEVPVSAVDSEVVEHFTLVVAFELCSNLFLVWFCDEPTLCQGPRRLIFMTFGSRTRPGSSSSPWLSTL